MRHEWEYIGRTCEQVRGNKLYEYVSELRVSFLSVLSLHIHFGLFEYK